MAVAICLALLWQPRSSAQEVRFELGVLERSGGVTPGFAVRFDGVRVEGGTVTLDLAHAGDAGRIGLGASTNWAFGPVGNVIVEGWGALRTDGRAEGRLGARGVAGPVAVGLTLVAFGDRPAAFRSGAVTSVERPQLAGGAFGVQLALTARLDRNVILELAPEYYRAGGPVWRGEARLRLLKLIGENEVDVLATGYMGPGGGEAHAAVGLGLTLPRGRAPDWAFAVLVGWSPAGPALGGRASLAEDVGAVRVNLEAAYEPYRRDVAPLRLSVGATAPAAEALGGGRWEASVQVATGSWAQGLAPATWGTESAATLALRFPLDLR